MPIKRPKRPRDPAQLAKLMIDIASGEVEDREPTPEEQGKDSAAVALGRKGRLRNGRKLLSWLQRNAGRKISRLLLDFH
jgi:hypothetical protein